jgi:hypothetical protein
MTWHDALRRTHVEQHDACRSEVDRVIPARVGAGRDVQLPQGRFRYHPVQPAMEVVL